MAFRCVTRTSTATIKPSISVIHRNLSFAQVGARVDGFKGQLTSMVIKHAPKLAEMGNYIKFKYEPTEDFTYHSRLLDKHIQDHGLKLRLAQTVQIKEIKENEAVWQEYDRKGFISWKKTKIASLIFATGMAYYCLKTGDSYNYLKPDPLFNLKIFNTVSGVTMFYQGIKAFGCYDAADTAQTKIKTTFSVLSTGFDLHEQLKDSANKN